MKKIFTAAAVAAMTATSANATDIHSTARSLHILIYDTKKCGWEDLEGEAMAFWGEIGEIVRLEDTLDAMLSDPPHPDDLLKECVDRTRGWTSRRLLRVGVEMLEIRQEYGNQ